MRSFTALVASAALALAAAGCDRPAEPKRIPEAKSETTEPASMVPDVPEEETVGSAMETIVKAPRDNGTITPVYRVDGEVETGRLVGACKWASAVVRRGGVPRPDLLDLDKAYAIKDPREGELKYYKNMGFRERWYYVNNYQGTYPTGVVVMVRGIKRGRRAMIDRPTFVIRQGRFRPHMLFGPINERVMFGTYDSYPTHVRMVNLTSGKVVLDDIATAFDRKTIKPLGGGGTHYTARPKMLQTRIVREMGPYEIRGLRHPWKKAYVIFIDNPYALVSNRGRFSIELPVGKWDIDVWHPEFKLVQERYQVVIHRDETTELAIRVHPPDSLKPKAARRPAAKRPGK